MSRRKPAEVLIPVKFTTPRLTDRQKIKIIQSTANSAGDTISDAEALSFIRSLVGDRLLAGEVLPRRRPRPRPRGRS